MKTLLIITVMLFSISAYGTTESKADINNSKVENKLSQEDFNRLTKRVEEIRKMDFSKLSAKERRELRKELKNDQRLLQPVIYIGAGTLLVIILLLILLL